MGEHARLLGRMLVVRLVIAAVVAGIVTPTLEIAVNLAIATRSGASGMGEPLGTMARAFGSSVTLGLILLLADYLLIRGRIGPAASVVTWAGRQEAAGLRALTGIRRPTDRRAAAGWLAAHPHAPGEDPRLTEARVHLQLVVRDVDGARASIGLLPTVDPAAAASAAVLSAQASLAAGQPFEPEDVRGAVLAVPDDDLRAVMHTDLAALIAQARSTCRGTDTLEPLLAVRPLVAPRDRGVMLTAYWAPMAVLVFISGLLIGFVFPG